MKNIKVILVEDDKKKIEQISSFLISYSDHFQVTVKESYQSGLRALLSDNYDLLLLDMSMPTWDKNFEEPGGEYEKFAGLKIIQEMVRKNKSIRTILITMFDYFGETNNAITLDELDKQLRNEYPEFYLGAVFYSSAESKWQNDLCHFIKIFTADEHINR